jgi:pimeloyl-ACP methyl ester carboxylesterase
MAGVSAGGTLLARSPLFANGAGILPTLGDGTILKKTSFGAIKQLEAGLLNVGFGEAGPPNGRAVILLHGWPYDIHSFVDVAPMLASADYRVIVPYLRGYGTTRFLSSETFRNGQQSALALDVIALMDALKIEKAILAGFDWGARTADIVAALWPERCKALVSVSGYLIGNQQAGKLPLPPKAELQWWYQYYLPPNPARPAMTNTGAILQSSSGSSHRRNGPSMMPPSIAPQHLSTTPTTLLLSSTTIAGALDWLKANPNIATWKSGLLKARSSLFPR